MGAEIAKTPRRFKSHLGLRAGFQFEVVNGHSDKGSSMRNVGPHVRQAKLRERLRVLEVLAARIDPEGARMMGG